MGFLLFQLSSGFRQPSLPCSLLHPNFCSSFLIFLSYFISLLALLYVLRSPSVLLLPLLILVPQSSRQMAGLRVMVRCLGGAMAYRMKGYCERHPVRGSRLFFNSLSSFSVFTLFLNMCSLCARRTHTVPSPWPSCCA